MPPFVLDLSKLQEIEEVVFRHTGGSVEWVADYDGVRYHLVLCYNSDIDGCIENESLRRVYEACRMQEEENVLRSQAVSSASFTCFKLFWPTIKLHHESLHGGDEFRIEGYSDDERCSVVKIQLKTIDGHLRAVAHGRNHMRGREPVENPFPDVQVFQKTDIATSSEIEVGISRVRLNEADCVVKAMGRTTESGFLQELGTLRRLPSHPNLVRFIGVVDAGNRDGKVDGIIVGYIEGNVLKRMEGVSEAQKAKWKREIRSAVELLHSQGIVWGDVKPGNILVDSKTDRPVLIDFGGGWTPGWVDQELSNSIEGDLQGLKRVLSFIDKLD